MGNEKELSVLIKMKADMDAAIKKVNDGLDAVEKKSSKSSKGMTDGFKKALKPITDVRLAFVRLGLAAGFIIGMTKAIEDVSKEISMMDSLSFKLGMTTEELSQKMYGFNIATDKAKIGISSLHIVTNDLKKLWEGVKVKGTEGVGFLGQYAGFLGAEAGNIATGGKAMGWNIGKAWNFSGEQLKKQDQEIKENSQATLETTASVENKIRQMKLSTYEYQKVLLSQELNDLKIAGVSETKLKEYQAGKEKELIQQRFGFSRFTDFMDKQFSSTITSMKGTMSGFINDAFHGSLKSGKEYFAEFGNSILKSFSDIIAEMIARWLILQAITGITGGGGGLLASAGAGAASNIASGGGKKTSVKVNLWETSGVLPPALEDSGGGSWHSGGIIRAHSGLALDEVPAILQTGEGVLSRRGMKALDQLNKGDSDRGGAQHVTYNIYAVDAPSFVSLCIKNPEGIHMAVQKNKRFNNE